VLTERRITFAVIAGIAVVFGLAGWRYFNGDTEKPQPQVARTAAPAAKPFAPVAAVAPEGTPALLNQFETTQQNLVDDLQTVQTRVTRQDAEIKRLKADLDALSQRYDTLSSFASTPKEAKADVDVQPTKKKKKRFVRRSTKRASK
jgi:phage shock protein A